MSTELVPTPPPTDPAPALDGYDPTVAMAEVILQTRRAVIPAIVVGVLALIVGVVIDELLVAVGICIGLGLGMANARMLR